MAVLLAQQTTSLQGLTKGMTMAVTADLAKVLDKAYEERTLTELVDAPVAALAGVSDGDAQLLKEAFNIKTIGDLGRNKYFRAAAAIVDLANSARRLRIPILGSAAAE